MNRAHCPYCGGTFDQVETWPRTCTSCGNPCFQSPWPVVNMVLPCEGGIVAIRRNLTPFLGGLAFPGGYIDHAEDWRVAARREVREELGLDLEGVPRLIGPPYSTRSNYLALFVTLPIPEGLRLTDIPAFHDPQGVSKGEISEVLLINPARRDQFRLGVPAHDRIWRILQFHDDIRYELPLVGDEN